MRTSWNPASVGSHSWGQKRAVSEECVHVLLEPPPKPCTKTRSATAKTEGSDRVVRPNGPLGYWISKSSTSFLLEKGRVNIDRLDGMSAIFWHGT